MPRTTDAPAIEARGVGKSFGATVALHDVSLTIATGEFVTLFGPNGAGKTSLVRIAATLSRASEGTVRILGNDVRTAPARLRRRIGVVSHRSFLYGELTARENLEFFARMFGCPDPAARAVTAASEVGIEDRLDDAVRGFSRGLEQRCAIARALVHEPNILLLDEPFSGLDPVAAANLERVLASAHARGRTVVMTSHDLARGAALAQRVGILHRGRLRYWGEPPGDLAAAFDEAIAARAGR